MLTSASIKLLLPEDVALNVNWKLLRLGIEGDPSPLAPEGGEVSIFVSVFFLNPTRDEEKLIRKYRTLKGLTAFPSNPK